MNRRNRRIGRGLMAGLAGGLIASWTMNQFQALWSKASDLTQEETKKQKKRPSKSQAEPEDATMKAADKVSRNILDRPLSKSEKKKAGPAVHYAFGGAMGGLYGLAAELAPVVTRGFGTGFGAALFVVADEITVPALGLSPKPAQNPLSTHVYGLVSHMVYGATVEGVRRTATATL